MLCTRLRINSLSHANEMSGARMETLHLERESVLDPATTLHVGARDGRCPRENRVSSQAFESAIGFDFSSLCRAQFR